jgi:hypothetical protein
VSLGEGNCGEIFGEFGEELIVWVNNRKSISYNSDKNETR